MKSKKFILILIIIIITKVKNDEEIEKFVWNKLICKNFTVQCSAVVMGHLIAESNLKSGIYQNSYHYKIGFTNKQYYESVNNNTYENFIEDTAGFGIAQWSLQIRKKQLLKYCEGKIEDLECQLDFLLYEIKKNNELYNYLKKKKNLVDCSAKFNNEFLRRTRVKSIEENRRIKIIQSTYDKFKDVVCEN